MRYETEVHRRSESYSATSEVTQCQLQRREWEGDSLARQLLFEVDLGENGGRHRFYDTAEVREWVQRERQFWGEAVANRWKSPFDQVNNRLTNLEQSLPIAEVWSEDQVRSVKDTLLNTFADANRIPHRTSAVAALVTELTSSAGLHAARGALAFSMPWAGFQGIAMEHPDTMKGAMAAAIADAGISRTSTAAMVKRLNGYTERRTEQMAREREALDEFFADQQHNMAELENQQRDELSDHTRLVAELENDFRRRVDDLGDKASDAIATIKQTDAQFREQMHLKAPSEYWEKKGKDHKEAARKLRWWIAVSTILGAAAYGWLLIANFAAIKTFLLEFQGSAPALFIITGAAAFVLAIPLWFLRILVKFYLSEQHLASDAKERHIMALTYLALTSDATIAEKDRAIVLSALFRSGQDGLVKDASAPDTSLAAVIARFFEK